MLCKLWIAWARIKQYILSFFFCWKTPTSTHWLQYSIASIKNNTIKSFVRKKIVSINRDQYMCYFHIGFFIKRLNEAHVNLHCFHRNAIELNFESQLRCGVQRVRPKLKEEKKTQSFLFAAFVTASDRTWHLNSTQKFQYRLRNRHNFESHRKCPIKSEWTKKEENYIIRRYLKPPSLSSSKQNISITSPPDHILFKSGPNLPSCTHTVNN